MPLFFNLPINKKLIESAITTLEQHTSAELRVYVEKAKPKKEQDTILCAYDIFYELEMDKTCNKNAVLIYMAPKDRVCCVIGDIGIHQYVSEDFWQQACDMMIAEFKQKQYTQGIIKAIQFIGEELIQYFPRHSDDRDELPNEVIIHD